MEQNHGSAFDAQTLSSLTIVVSYEPRLCVHGSGRVHRAWSTLWQTSQCNCLASVWTTFVTMPRSPMSMKISLSHHKNVSHGPTVSPWWLCEREACVGCYCNLYGCWQLLEQQLKACTYGRKIKKLHPHFWLLHQSKFCFTLAAYGAWDCLHPGVCRCALCALQWRKKLEAATFQLLVVQDFRLPSLFGLAVNKAFCCLNFVQISISSQVLLVRSQFCFDSSAAWWHRIGSC